MTFMAVVNPASANKTTGRAWAGISRRLREAGLEHESRLTTRPGEATELTRQALAEGYRTIVAVGGDGTVNEVVNGFFDGERWLGKGARLGILSRGTGSDLIKTLGLPKDETEAIARLKAGRTRRVDLGRVTFTDHAGQAAARYFINICGLGLDGDVVARVNRTTKAFGGKISFLWGTLATVAGYRNKDLEIVIDDGEAIKGRMCMVAVANGQYFGGGMRIAPQASPVDGLLDVVVLGDMGRLELVANLPKVYEGTHISHPKVSVWRVRQVEIHSVAPLYFQVDGDPLGETPTRLRVLPGALQVLV